MVSRLGLLVGGILNTCIITLYRNYPCVRQVATEKLTRQLESEVSEANTKMAEIQRELRDVTAQRNRLQTEFNDASSRLQTAENQLTQTQRAKTVLANQLDELRQAVDESSDAHTKVSSNYTCYLCTYNLSYDLS